MAHFTLDGLIENCGFLVNVFDMQKGLLGQDSSLFRVVFAILNQEIMLPGLIQLQFGAGSHSLHAYPFCFRDVSPVCTCYLTLR